MALATQWFGERQPTSVHGIHVAYGYDNADRLTSVTDFNDRTISIENTADGLPSPETLGASGDSINTTYDPTDSPSAIELESGSSTLLGFSYANAPSGAILAETDTPSSSQAPADYSYDAAGRVTSMTPGTGATLGYGFDASGERRAAIGDTGLDEHRLEHLERFRTSRLEVNRSPG
jgi:YD repeat-containing protein